MENIDTPSEKLIAQMERQLENSGFFTHSVLSRFAERINETEAFVYGLIDYLTELKELLPEDLQQYVTRVREEIAQKGEDLHAGVGLRVDPKEEGDGFTPVNCAERIHICKGICCQLNFALTKEEVESGKVKWELGHPYFIRHEKHGYCTHMTTEKKCCGIYENRPHVCKKYSCANDDRIWKDFDNMVLNQEWIEENLGEKNIRLFSIKMDRQY